MVDIIMSIAWLFRADGCSATRGVHLMGHRDLRLLENKTCEKSETNKYVTVFQMFIDLFIRHTQYITLPHQVRTSDHRSDLGNRGVGSMYEKEGCEQHEYLL